VVLFAGFRSTAPPARTLTGATIGGNAATIHVAQVNNDGTTYVEGSIVSLAVPTGTTATIVATYSGSLAQVRAHVYTLTGQSSGTPVATNSNAVASGDPSTTANVTGPGAAVALWVGTSGSEAGVAFTGVSSEDHDAAVTVTNGRNAVAHENGLTTETPRTFSGSSTMTAETIVVATWN
jgi:hypothetical protein